MRPLYLVVLAGCHQIFGLDPLGEVPPPPVDAPPGDVTLAMHDEDDDGLDDAIDSCPNIKDVMRDGDGDTIDDACDPHPDATGDRLFYFDSFDTLSQRWTEANAGGAWTVEGSALQQSNPAGTFYLLLDEGDEEISYPTVIAQVQAVSGNLGLALATTITMEGVACLVDTFSNGRLSFLENRPMQPIGSTIAMAPPTPVELRLEAKASEFGVNCRGTRPSGGALTVNSADDDTLPVDAARVALVTTSSTTTITSIAVYQFTP